MWTFLIIAASLLLPLARSTDNDNSTDLVRRWNRPPVTVVNWIAIGDSYSAGPGAGDDYGKSGKCYRTTGSYPSQMSQSTRFPGARANFNFQSCSGAKAIDVINNQVGFFTSETTIATLSITGNDIGFGLLAAPCIFGFTGDGDCASAIQAANDKIFGADLYNNYGKLRSLLLSKASIGNTDVYQTGYPSGFETYTTQCNDRRFGFFLHKGEYLTQDFRRTINLIGQTLNYHLAALIDLGNTGYTDYITFVDSDYRYTGHRFCRDGVTEPDLTNPDTWFFNYRSPDNAVTITQSAWAGIDTATCKSTTDATGDIGDIVNCAIARAWAADPTLQPADYASTTLPEWITKILHPTSSGHGAVAEEVLDQLTYSPTSLSGKKLRIMCIGDSITRGYKSSDNNGYRKSLGDLLIAAGNQVEFAGSQTCGSGIYTRCEGYNGAVVTTIHGNVRYNGALSERPNVIILMAGTNDINSGADPDVTWTQLRDIIDDLYIACPDAVVIVGHIPVIGLPTDSLQPPYTTVYKSLVRYNAQIGELVNEYRARGKHIVKVHTTPSQTFHAPADPLHPNDAGYLKLGHDFLQGIQQAGKLGWINDPVAGTGIGTLQTCANKPTWLAQGQIANGAGLGQDLWPGLICTPYEVDTSQCSCSTGGGTSSVQPKVGDNCFAMSHYQDAAVHFADLNGDGRADFLYVGQNGDVTALLNAGGQDTGPNAAKITWIPQGVIAAGVGGTRGEIQFADLNGDGRAEYLWVHADGSVDAWLNLGSASGGPNAGKVSWLAQGTIAGGIGPGAGVQFADLNGDGRAEYLYVDPVGQVTAYLNAGGQDAGPNAAKITWLPQGVIAAGGQLAFGARNNTVFADINGDGRAEYLLVSRTDGSVTEYLNAGGPDNGPNAAKVVWLPQGSIAGGVGSSGAGLQFADLNGDGRAEYLDVDPNTSAVNAYLNGC